MMQVFIEECVKPALRMDTPTPAPLSIVLTLNVNISCVLFCSNKNADFKWASVLVPWGTFTI